MREKEKINICLISNFPGEVKKKNVTSYDRI